MGKATIDIDEGLLRGLRRLAEERGREERELLEDAVRSYLQHDRSGTVRREIEDKFSDDRDEFAMLLERMSGRFDLDDENAIKIAVDEQHAWRRERRQGEGDFPS